MSLELKNEKFLIISHLLVDFVNFFWVFIYLKYTCYVFPTKAYKWQLLLFELLMTLCMRIYLCDSLFDVMFPLGSVL